MRSSERDLLPGGGVCVVRRGAATEVDHRPDGRVIAGLVGGIGCKALGASLQAYGDVGGVAQDLASDAVHLHVTS